MQKKVTLSVDDQVYKNFQGFCEENDILLSKRIERLMKEHLENSNLNKKRGKHEK